MSPKHFDRDTLIKPQPKAGLKSILTSSNNIPLEKFRRGADKVMRQASVLRIQDKLSQLESGGNQFKNHIAMAKSQNGKRKTVRISENSISDSASESIRTNTASTISASSSGSRLFSEDQLLDTMTQGDLQKRLTTLGGTGGIMSQFKDRAHSASGTNGQKRKGPGFERETTFPGLHPNSRRHPTSMMNWAMSVASGDSRGSGGSFDEVSNPTMNFLLRRYSVNDDFKAKVKTKTREKISNKLSLPLDRLSRIATLRQNVRFIEGKFKSLLNKQRTVDPREDTKSSLSSVAPDEYRPSRFIKPGQAYAFFRSRTQMIVICMRWIRMVMDMNKNSSWEKELRSFVDLAIESGDATTSYSDAKLDGGITQFDKNEFKANKEISLSCDVKTILSLRPEARTPSMLKQVMLGLQTLQSLSEYPLDTQEQLCKVAWFQQVPAKKYIIRQGHRPEAFYFILSGLAIVKKIEDGEKGESSTKVVARLTKGQSFGELGLIFKTPRNATVESGSPMELLVVGKSDFLKIFMHNVKPGEDPDHIAYLKQQPILRYWPFEALNEDPGACLINYFKRGTLITENGKTSEWIYFIKSGSCVALKRLKSVTPRTEKQLKRKTKKKSEQLLLPEITSKVNIHPRLSEKKAIHPELLRSMTEYFDEVRNSAEELRRAANADQRSSLSSNRKSPEDKSFMTIPDVIEPSGFNTTHVYFKRTPPREDINPYPLPCIPPNQSEGPGVSKSKFWHLGRSLGRGHFNVPTSGSLQRSFTEKRLPDLENVEDEKEDREDVFVTVEKLQARDIFGMNTISFSDEEEYDSSAPEVALVSRGAEIVMLSKKLFLKHADERVKLSVQELTTPYPLEKQLQENLQIKADWTLYRQQVISDVMVVNYALRHSLSGVV